MLFFFFSPKYYCSPPGRHAPRPHNILAVLRLPERIPRQEETRREEGPGVRRARGIPRREARQDARGDIAVRRDRIREEGGVVHADGGLCCLN